MGTHRWTRVQPLEFPFRILRTLFKFPSWLQGDNNDLMDLHYCWWKKIIRFEPCSEKNGKHSITLQGFGRYIQTVVELALGFFEPTTVSESHDFLNFEKNMRVRPFRGTTHDISGFFCVGSLHSVGSHPFGIGSILNLPQKWTDKCWATMIDPNHTEDNHTITPKDFDKQIICSVRCTRPRMSSKRRGARPMRRCRGTWCLRVLWRIGLWASLSIHHPKNLQLEVENYWPKKCRSPDVFPSATINQFISMCCGWSLGGDNYHDLGCLEEIWV